ncbi:Proteasome activator complex subunit 4 [Sphaceloma murrayae]|uniref:Proteasome activator complex subunit 4 n=1 Tax=Sphaceloma murrayae TaxID=2082308 RepID=A0A2K1QPA9_9PEZI|nr:Proteasome activator complex subunit 4 [Sphaceloma murrayae]
MSMRSSTARKGTKRSSEHAVSKLGEQSTNERVAPVAAPRKKRRSRSALASDRENSPVETGVSSSRQQLHDHESGVQAVRRTRRGVRRGRTRAAVQSQGFDDVQLGHSDLDAGNPTSVPDDRDMSNANDEYEGGQSSQDSDSDGGMPDETGEDVLAELLDDLATGNHETDDIDFEFADEGDVIPSPESVGDAVLPDPVELYSSLPDASLPTGNVDVDRFRARLLLLLTALWAEATALWSSCDVPPEERPISWRMQCLITNTSLVFFHNLFISGIPTWVQAAFGRTMWSKEEMYRAHVAAPPCEHDSGHCSIYRNLTSEGAQADTCKGYTGSTVRSFLKRLTEHLQKLVKAFLTGDDARSTHYQRARQLGVISSWRALTSFPVRVPQGYLYIMEAVWMVINGDLNDTGEYSKYARRAAFELAARIREKSGFPDSVFDPGMNRASPLVQSWASEIAGKILPCRNSACGRMTYPRTGTPAGEAHRGVYATGDPLSSGYLCGFCWGYRSRCGVLPNDEIFKARSLRQSARAKHGYDATCRGCGAQESEGPVSTKVMKGSGRGQKLKKSGSYQSFRVHEDYPEDLMCRTCHNRLMRDGHLPTPEVLEDDRLRKEI